MTHYIVVRVETPAGQSTTQQMIEAIASNLESVGASGVVAAALDKDDIAGINGVMKRKTLLAVF